MILKRLDDGKPVPAASEGGCAEGEALKYRRVLTAGVA